MLTPTRSGRTGSRLIGFGAASPDGLVDGADLGSPFGKSALWIESRTGIRSVRRLTAVGELTDLAERSAAAALDSAGLAASDVDLVISATCSVGLGPWDSRGFVERIAPVAAWTKLNAACSGFCYALSAADTLIRNDSAGHVLIVAAEHMSGLVDPADLGTSIIFGDGAGAAVVGPSTDGSTGIGPAVWGSDGSQANLIECDNRDRGLLRMAGQQVFRWAVERMPSVALEACARAGVSVDQIDVFVPHQANLRIIDAIARKIGLNNKVVADSVTRNGNTSAASIPIAVADLVERGLVRSGQLALLLGFGAGLSYAGQVVTLP